MPNTSIESFTKNILKYEPLPDHGSHVHVDAHNWHNVFIDTWKMDTEKPYLQMVGYFKTRDDKEVILCRRDIKLMDVKSLDFHNARSKFYSDLIHWSFHGFMDELHYSLTIADMIESRLVIRPFDPANAAVHETIFFKDKLELHGRMVHWHITSEKRTNGPFMQTIDFFVETTSGGVSRHFIIKLEATNPFIKIADHYNRHEKLIAETLGLSLEK